MSLKAAKVANNAEAATNSVYLNAGDYEQLFGRSAESAYLRVPMGLVYCARYEREKGEGEKKKRGKKKKKEKEEEKEEGKEEEALSRPLQDRGEEG